MNTAPVPDHLSHSSVALFLGCARQWKANYLDGIPRRISDALLKGRTIDILATHNWEQKRDTGRDITLTEAEDVAEDTYRTEVDDAGGRAEIDWGRSTFTSALESVLRMARAHLLVHAPLYTPKATQLEVRRPIEGSRRYFVGHLDALLDDGTVIDVKTSGRKLDPKAADTELQPTAYAYALGHPITFEFLRLVDNGRMPVYAEKVTTTRGQAAIDWYALNLEAIELAINAGSFPASPSWRCGHCSIAPSCIKRMQE